MVQNSKDSADGCKSIAADPSCLKERIAEHPLTKTLKDFERL